MSATEEPRVHPMLAGELERLLLATRRLRGTRTQTAEQRKAAVIAGELEFMGWKVQPSHQRRHQIERGIL